MINNKLSYGRIYRRKNKIGIIDLKKLSMNRAGKIGGKPLKMGKDMYPKHMKGSEQLRSNPGKERYIDSNFDLICSIPKGKKQRKKKKIHLILRGHSYQCMTDNEYLLQHKSSKEICRNHKLLLRHFQKILEGINLYKYELKVAEMSLNYYKLSSR